MDKAQVIISMEDYKEFLRLKSKEDEDAVDLVNRRLNSIIGQLLELFKAVYNGKQLRDTRGLEHWLVNCHQDLLNLQKLLQTEDESL